MASTATPYGLLPIRKIGSNPNAGGLTPYKIASGYATSIFFGDIVKIGTNGTLEKDTGTTACTPIGVFMGCQYTDSTIGFITRQYWPASTSASDAVALVCDDPDTIFKVQADGAMSRAEVIGANVAVVQGSGSTTTGKSGVKVDSTSENTTATLPLKVIGYDTNPENAEGDAFPDLHVIFNTHRFKSVGTTGEA